MVKIHTAQTRPTPGVSRAFTESDLRRNPELIGQAVAYAINYSGTFEFMQQCQARVLREGTLPLNLCRAVLNCMRQDPDIIIDYENESESHLAPVMPLPVPEQPVDQENHPSAQAKRRKRNEAVFKPQPPTEEEIDDAMKRIHPSWRHTLRARGRDFRRDIARDLQFEADGISGMRLEERKRDLEVPVKVKAPYGVARTGKVLHRVSPHNEHLAEWIVNTSSRWRNQIADTDARRFNLRVYWLCGVGTDNPRLTNERPEGMPYCKSGCFSARCSNCMKVTHLDPEAGPEDKIPRCRHCKQEFTHE